jgi:hypothetical protein
LTGTNASNAGTISRTCDNRHVKTRCRFTVASITSYNSWTDGTKEKPLQSVKLTAVYDDGLDKERASFSKATPSGTLEITVSNPAVVGTFEVGKDYYLDLIPVE